MDVHQIRQQIIKTIKIKPNIKLKKLIELRAIKKHKPPSEQNKDKIKEYQQRYRQENKEKRRKYYLEVVKPRRQAKDKSI